MSSGTASWSDIAKKAAQPSTGPVRRIRASKPKRDDPVPLTGPEDNDMDIVLDPVEVASAEIDYEPMETDTKEGYSKPAFKPMTAEEEERGMREVRRIAVPPHRMTPLRNSWLKLLEPLVQHMKLQVRMNTKRRCVEIRRGPGAEVNSLQKGADFMKAFMLGFDIQDAIALLRLDDLFLESFEVKDVKRLTGDHLSRCIGRIAGKDGKTKYAIENATRTRIVLAEDKIHLLGSFTNIRLARDAICSLILGSPPSKVYQRLRTVSKRVQERL
ncbi:pre-rRNA-processing protein pno1 [Perkinsus chesapeaki]|uniref:Pre-rRNA-processing protein pno1 n=1 Tax=Perkinsus chesapeaki TaxID=330153 RepID=A0A7J6N2N1_PERCH|nr:pre-rRNA-processing protein pno1 [Perkinsus chesapeaki]